VVDRGTVNADRAARYRMMVSARKECRRCEGLVNGSAIRDGEFDSDQIGPWTRWLGDLHARILIIGQDWGARRTFERQEGRDVPTGFVNRMVRELLESVGVQVPEVCLTSSPHGVFLTNAVLCFKDGGDQAPVQTEWFQACGGSFLRPQIELINPRVVVCLGERAYAAVLSAYQLPAYASFLAAVEGPGVQLPGGPIAFAVYHPSQRSMNMNRNREAQFKDWRRIAAVLERPESSADGPAALCECGCGERAENGGFRMGHDQNLRIALEARVGGILALRAVVHAVEAYASGRSDLEELGRVVRSTFWGRD
jgi:uracil-DNA glycosylase family 4